MLEVKTLNKHLETKANYSLGKCEQTKAAVKPNKEELNHIGPAL